MIGIIGAMDIEIEHINAVMEEKEEFTVSGALYTRGRLDGKDVVTAVCGIGKVFAAMCAQTMIVKFGADTVINTGVAGGLTDKTDILDTVVATALVQHDMDTTYFGDPRGLISGINVVEFPCDKALAEKITANVEGNCVRGIVASGDCFVADNDKKKEISETFNAVACEMEGAAIAQVCYVNKIPFCVLRTISDGANGEEMSYEKFRVVAAEKAANIIIKTIKEI
ncbi:MAG: 5'-methylthioadenosine/adenosylhomocysteine nucleosidase [Clostridia bacterium]|nr:5'-methylthioadenosine/adenosylhomocysteine nucleosidase [Clostridia bacterium]